MRIEEVTILRHAITEGELYQRDGASLSESPEIELAKKLPSLAKHDYTAIDRLMRGIARKHKISNDALENLFHQKFKKTPRSWLTDELDEGPDSEVSIEDEVTRFAAWASKKLHLKNPVKIELSYDTEEAQEGHHTGRHIEGSGEVWVYAANRNLVDILRTVFHELVHCRQGEIGMIKQGDSYPGSPIEVLADALAGKYIKIYGAENPQIFQ